MPGSLSEIAAVFSTASTSALGLIAAVAIQLGRVALVDPLTILIAVASLAILLRLPLAAPALVVAGGAIGVIGGR